MPSETVTPDEIVIRALTLLSDLSQEHQLGEVGACVVNTVNGPKCFMLTPDQCNGVLGNYIGGTCT